MEIEKKFQIKKLPDNLEAYPKKEIEQGFRELDKIMLFF